MVFFILSNCFSKYKIALLFILFIGVSLFSNGLYAQPVSVEMKDYQMRAERADSCLTTLENSVLIVRLPTYRKKIERLEQLEKNSKLSKKQRSRATQQKELQIEDLEKLKEVVFTGLYEHYDFSDFLITNDTLWDDFLAGKNEGVFYNERQEIDPSIKYIDSTYFVLHYGRTDYGKTNNQLGFIVADAEMNDLERPFPYFLKIINTSKSINGMFKPDLNFYQEPTVMGEFSRQLILETKRIPIREAKRERRRLKQKNKQ